MLFNAALFLALTASVSHAAPIITLNAASTTPAAPKSKATLASTSQTIAKLAATQKNKKTVFQTCAADSECQQGCCGFSTGKCAGPDVAQSNGSGGCGHSNASPNCDVATLLGFTDCAAGFVQGDLKAQAVQAAAAFAAQLDDLPFTPAAGVAATSTAAAAGTTAASGTTTTASPASTSSSSSSDFHLQNGLDAQKLNAQFQSLTANSSCTPGQEACIGTSFAQCVSGSFTLTQCAAGTICAALPLVNKAGTSIGCDTSSDIAARIAATGATGGLTGSDSSGASSSSADSGSDDGDDEDSGDCDAEGDDDDNTSASGTPSSTIVFTSPSTTPSATASDSDCDSDDDDDDSVASSSQSPSSTIILLVPSSSSTVVASSSASAATSSAPAPSSSATTLLAQNGMAAQKLNAKFKTLTAGAACTSGAQACIGDSFAQCVKGAYVLSPCSGGNICAAVPLADGKAGTSVGCDAPEDVQAKIAATGVAGGITGV